MKKHRNNVNSIKYFSRDKLIKQRARKQGMNFQFKSLKRMKISYYQDETP